MKHRPVYLLCTLLLAAGLAGCGGRFTRQNYDTVYVGQDISQVEDMLGWPDATMSDRLIYVNNKPFYRGEIFFDESGKVTRKTWSDEQTFAPFDDGLEESADFDGY